MRIEFDPTNPDEAAAVRAMLTAMHPTYPGTNLPLMQGREITKEDYEWPSDDEELPAPTSGPREQVVKDVVVLPTPSLDSTGTPWDARIHSTPAKTNADGTWRAKRGVKAEEIAAVRAEREPLEAGYERIESPVEMVLDVPAQEQTAPPAPNAPVGEQSAPPAPPAPSGQSEAPFVPDASVETNTTQTNSPSNGTEVNATGSATSAAPPSFLDVMKAITAAQKDGKIDTAKVKELCAAVGAGESTMGLNGPDNGDKRVAFMAALEETING